MRYLILFLFSLAFPFLTFAETQQEEALPPLLTKKQAEMLYYLKSGTTPDAIQLKMPAERFQQEYDALLALGDITQFRMRNFLLLWGYASDKHCQVLTARAGINLKSNSLVKMEAENEADFTCWTLSPDQLEAMYLKNDNTNMLNLLSTITVLGTEKINSRNIMHVHVEEIIILSHDKKTVLDTLAAVQYK